MDKLKEALSYDEKFIKYLENEKFKNIINKYNPKEKYNEFISEVLNLFSEGYNNFINRNLSQKEFTKYLFNTKEY